MAATYTKTNALRMLDDAGIAYTPRMYLAAYALDGARTAELIGVPYSRVFKTLAAVGASGAFYVFVIPVNEDLDLKLAAEAVSEKSVAMLPLARLTDVTGYVRGGCSPVGMKKRYRTVIDASALQHERICVSAGRVGLMMELAASDLAAVIGAKFEFLCARYARAEYGNQ